jgi:hypothetical protein
MPPGNQILNFPDSRRTRLTQQQIDLIIEWVIMAHLMEMQLKNQPYLYHRISDRNPD